MVPLANAWISGAWRWTPARRHAFAHDLDPARAHIAGERVGQPRRGRPQPGQLATSAQVRLVRVRPPKWIAVEHHYGLSVTLAEKSALRDMLDMRGGQLKLLTTLEKAGYVQVIKGYAGKRPRTWLKLTPKGREAFIRHLAALRPSPTAQECPKRIKRHRLRQFSGHARTVDS